MYQYYVRKFMDIEEIEDWLDGMNEAHFLFDVISITPCNLKGCRFLVAFRVLEPLIST